jgi:hypothetical protein
MLLIRIQKYNKHIAAFLLWMTAAQMEMTCLGAARTLGAARALSADHALSAARVPGASVPVTPRGSALLPDGSSPFTPYGPTMVRRTDEQKPVALLRKQPARRVGPGPGQPEQQSFQSVNSENMVDPFTGDFSYNIPLLDVGGYPINIHYRSGVSMDQEASWVGLGWNINPGSVNRNMRGIPDDFNGDTVTKTQNVRTNWTAGVNLGADPEFFGFPVGLNANAGLFYNNYRGIGFETGESINVSLTSAKGADGGHDAGVGINLNNNSQNGISIEPSFYLNRTRMEDDVNGISNGFSVGASFSTRRGLQDLTVNTSGSKLNLAQDDDQRQSPSDFSSSLSFAHRAYTPTVNLPYTSYQFNFSVKLGGEADGFHPLGSIGGYFSSQAIENSDTIQHVPAYGYVNLQNGYANTGSMLDFNREKDLPSYSANPPTPNLAIPNYTYDLYSIGGEGTGGMFRPYRSDVGYVRDPVMRSKSTSGGGSIDLGAGDVFHGGIDGRFSYTTTASGAWTDNNLLAPAVPFTNPDSTYENVYFRNPSEKAINAQAYYNKIGDTSVLLPVMTNSNDPTLTATMQPYNHAAPAGAPLVFNASLVKTSRDKRTQVISILRASDAANFGLDHSILNYPVNSFILANCGIPSGVTTESRVNYYRKAHHFSQVTVLNNDGKRYIYGLPVYNLDQEEVSFSVSSGRAAGNSVGYQPGSDNTSHNQLGKDYYYSREKIQPYASSFLITGLVSADYVDRTGDGITDDDQGDAVKFNYSKIYGADNPYRWRTPYARDSATYQPGLKTDVSDDKGSYVYGTKEIWYMNSIITKTMVATFTLNDPTKGESRQDGYGVLDENGGLDQSHGLRYLKQIDLYSKADYMTFLAKGVTPTPIKTVHFVYSYTLCPGAPGSLNGQGKLTLDSIWFSYNGNNRGHLNPYVFHYHANNPGYNNGAYDRWGNYKHPASNPAGMSNMDFPYALQNGINGWDSTHAAYNAGAWTLDSIELPSKGALKIDYEADDYAYVQNRRATEMMTIAGFAKSSNDGPDAHLFNSVLSDYGYVYIHVPNAVTNRTDVYNQYLDGIGKIYVSFMVKMPSDIYGSGYEHVATYAQYDDYGVSSSDNHMIWVHMVSAQGGLLYVSPLAMAAIQSLRLNLPSKAFPGSDLEGQYDPIALGKALIGYLVNFSELITNFPTRTRLLGNACLTDPTRSFVRLDNPTLHKFGGGLRVKRIVISDNFKAMTGQQNSVYGQQYDYTTVQTIHGVPTRISSGVASWEPSIGNEENPFRLPVEYTTQVSPLAPSNNMYTETPLGEGYFPNAEVGYSNIRVHTINSQASSANGYEETQFYTTYDFPTITEQTPLDSRQFKPSILASLFKIDAKSYLALTQGFKVEINDMNGKVKEQASYPENDPTNPVTYTKFYYKTDNDSAVFKHLSNVVPVADSASGHVNMNGQIGKDIELMVDLREENTQTKGIDLEFNMDAFILGIIPLDIPMVWPFPQYEVDRYRSASTMKLVQRYGILDKTLHYDRGSLISTQNMLYDAETGDVILTKTQNEFNDPIYQFSYPAHWAYSGMEPAYKNTGAVFSSVTFTNGKISAPNYPNVENYFESGDELMVNNAISKVASQPALNPCTGEGTCAAPLWSGTPVTQTLWAVSAAKIQNNKGLTGIYFVDQWGNFFTSNPANPLSVTILRSGKRNLAASSIGKVQSLASPLRQVNGQWRIVFDDQTRTVNTAANTYNDFWKVEDARFVLTTTVTTRKPNLHTIYIFPATTNSSLTISNESHGGNRHLIAYPNRSYFEAAQFNQKGNGWDQAVYSWLHLNIPSAPAFAGDTNYIPSGAVVQSAWLYLRPHLSTHYEVDGSYAAKFHNNVSPHSIGAHDFIVTRPTDPTFNSLTFANMTTWTRNQLQNVLNMSTDVTNQVFLGRTIKQNSEEINITGLMKGMMANLFQPQVIELEPNSLATTDNYSRYCFWSRDTCRSFNGSFACQENSEPGGYTGPSGGFGVGCGISKVSTTCNVGPYIKLQYTYCPGGGTGQTLCDTTYCLTTTSSTNCLSNITDTTVNPYRFGALGNWRAAKNLVYYDNRKETSVAQPTDIRNDGTITGYEPYWTFTTGKMSPVADTVKWIWKLQSTLYNKRGLELENVNVLGINNSAQYGFNESLPVTTVKNSPYKAQAYDGFEDYHFSAGLACTNCVVPRHINTDSTATNLTTAEAHTGKYSLFIGPGHSAMTSFALTPATPDSAGMLTMRIDTMQLPAYTIRDLGHGLADTLYKFASNNTYLADNYGLDNYAYGTYGRGLLQYAPFPGVNNVIYNSNSNQTNTNPITITSKGRFTTDYKVIWDGQLLTDADYLGMYFRVASTHSFKLWINDQMVLNTFANDPVHYNGSSAANYEYSVTPMNFRRSKIYHIRVEQLVGNSAAGEVQLYWANSPTGAFTNINPAFLYPSLTAAKQAISTKLTPCYNFVGITAQSLLYKELAPAIGTKVLVSVWVKEQQDCHCNTYTHANLGVYFRDQNQNGLGYATGTPVYATGNIIEGWQRIEVYVTIPAGAASMYFILGNNNSDGYKGQVYFDDLRVHPFNAEMKSYVYDDDNLRLKAELDENNYATFYEYDDDGTLIRVKKETEQGIKTIKEVRNALVKNIQ